MSTYSSELSDTSCSETLAEIKKKKRKHHSDGGKLLKYYKYLYEQKCKESDHYKKLYRAKNKECEQLTLLNQQYQGRVIAYLLESHTNNPSGGETYASSASGCSSQNELLRDEDFHGHHNDVDDHLMVLHHNLDGQHLQFQSQHPPHSQYPQLKQRQHRGSGKDGKDTDTDSLELQQPTKSYDFVVDVSRKVMHWRRERHKRKRYASSGRLRKSL